MLIVSQVLGLRQTDAIVQQLEMWIPHMMARPDARKDGAAILFFALSRADTSEWTRDQLRQAFKEHTSAPSFIADLSGLIFAGQSGLEPNPLNPEPSTLRLLCELMTASQQHEFVAYIMTRALGSLSQVRDSFGVLAAADLHANEPALTVNSLMAAVPVVLGLAGACQAQEVGEMLQSRVRTLLRASGAEQHRLGVVLCILGGREAAADDILDLVRAQKSAADPVIRLLAVCAEGVMTLADDDD